jgi:hypothetical protein
MVCSLDIIAQTIVFIFGLLAIFLVGLKDRNYRRYGYLAGLIGQTGWFYTTIYHKQYLVFIMIALCTIAR